MDPRFVAVSEPRLPAGSAPPRRSKPRPSGWSREPKSALPSEMKPQRSPEVRCPSSSLQRRRCVPHDSDEDRGSKSTERANPRGEPRDRARVAETGQADPKACAARDRFASVNRTQHTPALRNRTASREPPSARATSPDRSVGRSLETRLVWHHDASRCCHRRARAKRRHRRAKRTRSEQAIAETVSVLPSGRPRRPKPLERSTRKRRTGCPSNGAIDSRRPKPPGACRAALGTGARSTPRRIDRPKLTETAQRIADGVPEMVPKVRRLPGRSRRSSCTIRARTGAQTPQVCPPFQPRSRSRLDDSCARTGRPVAEGAPPSPAETRKKTTTTAPRRGARWPKLRPPPRPKPGRRPQRLRPDGVPGCRRCFTRTGRNRGEIRNDCARTGCPRAEGASLEPAETNTSRATTASRRLPGCRSHVTPRGRNREEIDDSSARTGARRSQARHFPQPKPRRGQRRQRSDGCPKVAGASLSAAETTERSASTTLGRVPVCRRYVASTRPKPQRGAATSVPEQVPVCRRDITPSSRNRREQRHIDARTGARLPTRHHPLQPKPERAAPHRRPDGCPFAEGPSHPAVETERSSEQSTTRPGVHQPTHATSSSRNQRRRRDIDARTSARLPTRHHPLQPKPKRAAPHRRPDGCPFADGPSQPPAETRGSSERSASARVPLTDDTSPPSAEAKERSATSTRGGARLLPRAPPPAAEATDDLTRDNPRTVPVCRSALRHPQPKPRTTSHETAPGRVPVCRTALRHPQPKPRTTSHETAPGRVPDQRDAISPHQPKPAKTSRTANLGRVPGHRDAISPHQPKPAKTSRTANPGRVPGRGTLDAIQPKPEGDSRTSTLGRVPGRRDTIGAPRPAKATEHVSHLDFRTGRPGRSTLTIRRPKPEDDSRTSTLGRVPVRRDTLRPAATAKSQRSWRASTPGRVPGHGTLADPGRNQRRRRAHRLSDGARSQHARPTLAETRGDVAHIDSRTGARVRRDTIDPQPPLGSRAFLAAQRSGRVSGRGTLDRLQPKPAATSRTSTFGRVPDRRRTISPLQPKPERTSRAPTAGRVSPFPLIQLTINERTARDQVVPCGSAHARRRPKPPAHDRWTAQHHAIDTSSARNQSGESASHTAQKGLHIIMWP
jgi:hypothetical protein